MAAKKRKICPACGHKTYPDDSIDVQRDEGRGFSWDLRAHMRAIGRGVIPPPSVSAGKELPLAEAAAVVYHFRVRTRADMRVVSGRRDTWHGVRALCALGMVHQRPCGTWVWSRLEEHDDEDRKLQAYRSARMLMECGMWSKEQGRRAWDRIGKW